MRAVNFFGMTILTGLLGMVLCLGVVGFIDWQFAVMWGVGLSALIGMNVNNLIKGS